ncbi:MAG: GAF domain-containing protein [Armatimonadetes bacterium]|nr:GAF domain-containing protein [Armatimonadota bacterium]
MVGTRTHIHAPRLRLPARAETPLAHALRHARRRPVGALALSLGLLAAVGAAARWGGAPLGILYLLPVALAGVSLDPPLPLLVSSASVLLSVLTAGPGGHPLGGPALVVGVVLVAAMARCLRKALDREAVQSRALEGMRTLASAVTSSLDLRQVLQTAVAQALALTHARAVGIWLLDRDRGELLLASSAERSPAERVRADASCVPLDSQHVLARSIADRAILVTTVQQSGAPGALHCLCVSGVHRVVAVPLVARGTPVGVLAAGVTAAGAREAVHLLCELAHDVAVAVDNARLYAEARRARVAFEAWNRELEARVAAKTRELEEAHRELLHAERLASIGQLAASVAHELRNPLNVIKVSRYALARGVSPEKQQRHLGAIDRQVSAATAIINALLDFTHEAPPHLAPASARAIAARALAEADLPPGIIATEEHADPLPQVYADAARIGQALAHLIRNAVQAMPAGGRVAVHTYARAGRVWIAVDDTGPGIPEGIRPRIFEPLFTTRTKGTGLGLAIVRRVVEAHDGEIQVESAPGAGTRFAIGLPRLPYLMGRGRAPSAPTPDPDGCHEV